MIQRTIHTGSMILILCQLLLVGADFIHTDVPAFGGFPASLQKHECGANEIHKALDSCQPCLPCHRNTATNPLFGSLLHGAVLVQSPLAVPDPYVPQGILAASSISKRGPPSLTAI